MGGRRGVACDARQQSNAFRGIEPGPFVSVVSLRRLNIRNRIGYWLFIRAPGENELLPVL